jgi:hypothetical protein
MARLAAITDEWRRRAMLSAADSQRADDDAPSSPAGAADLTPGADVDSRSLLLVGRRSPDHPNVHTEVSGPCLPDAISV